ncbi:MAG: LysM domain-containing protein [Chloroflexi bacterium]|nr:MAG: LysM domain-containing protein [Chloroflexota bacterium]
MRRLLLIVLLLLVGVACRNGGESEDTGAETSGAQQVEAVEDTPRIEDTPVPPTATTLPATSTPVPLVTPEHIFAATERLIHVIQPGDTLSELAVQYNTTVDAISDANRHYNFDLIYAGDWIYIPDCPDKDVLSIGNLNLSTDNSSSSSSSSSSDSDSDSDSEAYP